MSFFWIWVITVVVSWGMYTILCLYVTQKAKEAGLTHFTKTTIVEKIANIAPLVCLLAVPFVNVIAGAYILYHKDEAAKQFVEKRREEKQNEKEH